MISKRAASRHRPTNIRDRAGERDTTPGYAARRCSIAAILTVNSPFAEKKLLRAVQGIDQEELRAPVAGRRPLAMASSAIIGAQAGAKLAASRATDQRFRFLIRRRDRRGVGLVVLTEQPKLA